MSGLTGRASSSIRTPQLVLDHLRSCGMAGDFEASIHEAVKAFIKANKKGYQWPRSHSFRTLLRHLRTLGLVEPTGMREDSPILDPAIGFEQRDYIRLAPGSDGRPEWLDPYGALRMTHYPNWTRGAGYYLGAGIPMPRLPRLLQPPRIIVPRPLRAPRFIPDFMPPVPGVSLTKLAAMRQHLRQEAAFAVRAGAGPVTYSELAKRAREFLDASQGSLSAHDGAVLTQAVDVLRLCAVQLRKTSQLDPGYQVKADACRQAAEILAEFLGALRIGGEPDILVPSLPELTPGPPEANLQDLDEQRMALQQVAVELGQSGEDPAVFLHLATLGESFVEQARPYLRATTAGEMEGTLSEFGECVTALAVAAGPQRTAALNKCRNTARLLAAIFARPMEGTAPESRGPRGDRMA